MSRQLISHSPDLQQLQDEGYDIEVKSGFLLLKHVPYVNPQKEVKYGVLVTSLTLAGDRTATPSDHVVTFAGEYPSHSDGTPFDRIINARQHTVLAPGLEIDYTFSSKPPTGYPNYYEKMTTYVDILMSQAIKIDPNVTARTFPVIETTEDESVFKYIDTATSRAGIGAVSVKLELERVAIIGLGGTGSYILDLVAKTPVKEIHLYDGDKLLSHNAFRSPGAPTVDQLRAAPSKVTFFRDLYSQMRRGVIAHEAYLDAANIGELESMSFVFLAFDQPDAKKLIVERLIAVGIQFVDVGMGVDQVAGQPALAGILRVTTSSKRQHSHIAAKSRIPFASSGVKDEYANGVQIADLNSLNAALAVIKWKKLFGFYLDLEDEHHSTYTIDGNALTNEDRP